ncbi:MAG: hypothetical protein OCC45_11780 [Desulfotalea sp.]
MINKKTIDLLLDTCLKEELLLEEISNNLSTMRESDLRTKLESHHDLRNITTPILTEIDDLSFSDIDEGELEKIKASLKNIQTLNKEILRNGSNQKALIKSELSTMSASRNALSGYSSPTSGSLKKSGNLLQTCG